MCKHPYKACSTHRCVGKTQETGAKEGNLHQAAGGPLEERPPASLSGTASTRHTRQHGTTKKRGAKVHASGETEGWDENT